jgi:hypothetical protein
MTSSGENQPEPNSQLIQQLSVGIQSTSALIQGLLREIRENSLTLASFEGELSGLQRTVVSLNRVLQEGDGRESILTRVALLEKEVEAMAKGMATMVADQKKEASLARQESTALIKQEMEGKVKVRLGKLQTVGIVTPAVLAFILSLLALLRG